MTDDGAIREPEYSGYLKDLAEDILYTALGSLLLRGAGPVIKGGGRVAKWAGGKLGGKWMPSVGRGLGRASRWASSSLKPAAKAVAQKSLGALKWITSSWIGQIIGLAVAGATLSWLGKKVAEDEEGGGGSSGTENPTMPMTTNSEGGLAHTKEEAAWKSLEEQREMARVRGVMALSEALRKQQEDEEEHYVELRNRLLTEVFRNMRRMERHEIDGGYYDSEPVTKLLEIYRKEAGAFRGLMPIEIGPPNPAGVSWLASSLLGLSGEELESAEKEARYEDRVAEAIAKAQEVLD